MPSEAKRSCRHAHRLDAGCVRVPPSTAQTSTCSEEQRRNPTPLCGWARQTGSRRVTPLAAQRQGRWHLTPRQQRQRQQDRLHIGHNDLQSRAAVPSGQSSWPRCRRRRCGHRGIPPLAARPDRLLAPQGHPFGSSVNCCNWHQGHMSHSSPVSSQGASNHVQTGMTKVVSGPVRC